MDVCHTSIADTMVKYKVSIIGSVN